MPPRRRAAELSRAGVEQRDTGIVSTSSVCEPGAHLGQLDHRAREQPRAREQHDRHRDLRDDERALQPLLPQRRRSIRRAPAEIHYANVPSLGSVARNDSNSASATDSASAKPSTTPSSRISFARGE